jgi:hypothetical protein
MEVDRSVHSLRQLLPGGAAVGRIKEAGISAGRRMTAGKIAERVCRIGREPHEILNRGDKGCGAVPIHGEEAMMGCQQQVGGAGSRKGDAVIVGFTREIG